MAFLFDFGRSRTCPTDARTVYLPPRYFEIVFAFEGDSTISNLFAMIESIARIERVWQMGSIFLQSPKDCRKQKTTSVTRQKWCACHGCVRFIWRARPSRVYVPGWTFDGS